MDHEELLGRIEHRLKSTDEKIAETKALVESVKKDLKEYAIKTAVLETQMSGVIRFGMILATSVVGVIATLFMKSF